MFQTQLHLFLAHLPIFGTFFGILVLTQGIYKRSNPAKMASYYIFIVSVACTLVVYFTGAAAQKNLGKFTEIPQQTILLHQYFGKMSILTFVLLGIFAFTGIIISPKNISYTKFIAALILIISIVCFGIAIKTGITGNKIRHHEINNVKPIPPQPIIDEVQ